MVIESRGSTASSQANTVQATPWHPLERRASIVKTWLGRIFALIGALTITGIASVALGVMFLWRKDRQWEQELNRTSPYDSIPTVSRSEAPTTPQADVEAPSKPPAATAAAPESAKERGSVGEMAESGGTPGAQAPEGMEASSGDRAKAPKSQPRRNKAAESPAKTDKAKKTNGGPQARSRRGTKPSSGG